MLRKVYPLKCPYELYRLGAFVIGDKKQIIPMTRGGGKTLAVIKYE